MLSSGILDPKRPTPPFPTTCSTRLGLGSPLSSEGAESRLPRRTHTADNTIRAMTRNHCRYPDPNRFDPGRWLDPEFPTYRLPLEQYPNLNGFSQFGFGRRTCQGVPVVEQDLFMSMGGMAWAFTVGWARRSRAMVLALIATLSEWNKFTPLLIAKPEPFPFNLYPRSYSRIGDLRNLFTKIRDEVCSKERRTDLDMSKFLDGMEDILTLVDEWEVYRDEDLGRWEWRRRTRALPPSPPPLLTIS